MLLTNVLSRVIRRAAPPSRQKAHQKPAHFGRSFVPRLEILEDRTVLSIWTVTSPADSGDGSLRATIAAAQSADQIVFDPSLQGQTITLSSGELDITKDLDIEGLGADQLAISGNHQSRIFNISGGVTVTIAGLTLTDALGVGPSSTSGGGAILNTGSKLTVANAVFSNNEARAGANGSAGAGAINSILGATLTVMHSQFLYNRAIADNAANAGAINVGGGSSASVTGTTFLGNQTIGGSGGQSGFSRGAAIYINNATVTVANSTFTGNQALGGSNNTGDNANLGLGAGGGIFNADRAILFLSGSTFTGNQALGGSNNVSTSTGNLVSPGSSYGGGLYNIGLATVTDSTFEDNEARGGSGNRGGGASFQNMGTAAGGAISIEATNTSSTRVSLVLSDVTLRHNRAIGGDGNTAGTFTAATFLGTAWGGGLECDDLGFGRPPGGSTTTISNSLITDNQAVGGQGAAGEGGADGLGGRRGERLRQCPHRFRQYIQR
jgi:hypothetical protein